VELVTASLTISSNVTDLECHSYKISIERGALLVCKTRLRLDGVQAVLSKLDYILV